MSVQTSASFALFLVYNFLFFHICTVKSLTKRASVCYGVFGCFSTRGTLYVLPMSPDDIEATLTLKVRGRQDGTLFNITEGQSAWNSTLTLSGFNIAKETKFVIHGFTDSGSASWISHMVSELLKHGDYNIFIVDWRHGSRALYPQATANSLLVASEVAIFLDWLHSDKGLDLNKVHLIGHSLGAHVAGNTGGRLTPRARRISGLDPAEPFFKDDFDDSLRLDKSDADFVDVIHTDGSRFNLLQGYGLSQPLGDADFYPNGGVDQPGCTDHPLGGLFGGSGIGGISCSHSRSISYFTESINGGCRFNAYPCDSWARYEAGECHGCPSTGCPQMGFHAEESTARGNYYVSTAESSPYCGHEYYVEMQITSNYTNAYGRLYMTVRGQSSTSREIEFTRDDRHYHENQKETHMVALGSQVGSISGIDVRFQRGQGLSSLGTQHDLAIHKIIVEDAVSRQRAIFCTQDSPMHEDYTFTFRSHSGC